MGQPRGSCATLGGPSRNPAHPTPSPKAHRVGSCYRDFREFVFYGLGDKPSEIGDLRIVLAKLTHCAMRPTPRFCEHPPKSKSAG